MNSILILVLCFSRLFLTNYVGAKYLLVNVDKMNEYIDSEDMTHMDKNVTSTSSIEYNNRLQGDIDLNTGKLFDFYRSNYCLSILLLNYG